MAATPTDERILGVVDQVLNLDGGDGLGVLVHRRDARLLLAARPDAQRL